MYISKHKCASHLKVNHKIIHLVHPYESENLFYEFIRQTTFDMSGKSHELLFNG